MNIFLISDTHFGHKGVTQFLNNDGTKAFEEVRRNMKERQS
jgi:calcineurin-like phosphoesterase family protein